MSKWTRFYDMASGGDHKEPFDVIYIEAPEAEAERIFSERFGHDPGNITCDCCGSDYSVSEYESLEEAQKGCSGTLCVITRDEITSWEK